VIRARSSLLSRAATGAVAGCLVAGICALPASARDSAMGFALDVTLSPQAEAQLASLQEKITVWALWSGQPTKAAKKQVDEEGKIDLGTEEVTLPASGGHAEFTGRSVKPGRIGWVKDRDVQILVNVYSARLSGPNNILNCDIFDGSVTAARATPPQIVCKLIEEH
jgi:hypothetical protein